MPGLPQSIHGWQPMTFLERGAAVPFTTPHLTGARLRLPERGGPELIVPNVAGRGSVGILPWDRVGSLCSPTVFDRRLAARLAQLPVLTPAAVREAAVAEAAPGLAGPEAQEAAQRARQDDAAERARARTALLDRAPGAAVPAELAALLGPLGIDDHAEAARLPRTLAALVALGEQIAERQQMGDGAADADAVVAAVRHTAAAALAALVNARDLAADPPALLRRWTAARAALSAELRRAEWLLDGWAWLCRFWAAPDQRASRAAARLADVAALVPPLPREAGAGPRGPRPQDAPWGRAPQHGSDWRGCVTPQDLIARNERLLAGVLAMPEGTS